MGTDAGAGVVGTDSDDAEGVGGVRGNFAEVDEVGGFGAGHEFDGNIDGEGDDCIDSGLNFGDLGVGWGGGKDVVAFRFFALDMGVSGAGATEHPDHCGIENVLGGVHRRIFLFVV